MKLSEVNELIEEKIESKTSERNHSVFDTMGFSVATDIYSNNICNISSLINTYDISDIAILSAVSSLLFFKAVKDKHPLSQQIYELKKLEQELLRYNKFRDSNKNEINYELDKICKEANKPEDRKRKKYTF